MTTMFTKAVGISFIILSILRFTPFINATGKWLLYVSISAFSLVLYDLVEFFFERRLVRTGMEKNKVSIYLQCIFIVCAVMAVIVLPYLKINISVKKVNALSDFFTLVSLGIAIILIGFKSDRAQSISINQTKETNDQISDFLNSTEGQRIIKEHIDKKIENL